MRAQMYVMSVIKIANCSSTYKCLKGFLQNFS